jgi:endonuclease/exonuclease/phosphatase family metal-dependent hydrolase
VVSWNIQFGVEHARAAAEIDAADELRDGDIFLLQEMDEEGTAAIAETLGAGYAFASAAPHQQTGRDFGNAIVSRWPIEMHGEVALPYIAPIGGQPRSATSATVTVDGCDVSAYSVHTEVPTLRLARRIEQFAAVADDVRRRDVPRALVGGDFNTVTERGVRALTETMGAAGLLPLSSRTDASYRGRGRALILDHIFGLGFVVVDHGVVRGTQASDHDPIWVELRPQDGSR